MSGIERVGGQNGSNSQGPTCGKSSDVNQFQPQINVVQQTTSQGLKSYDSKKNVSRERNQSSLVQQNQHMGDDHVAGSQSNVTNTMESTQTLVNDE